MLEQRVLETLRFFALQQIGVTLFELHKYLVSPADTIQINIAGELTQTSTVDAVSIDAVSRIVDALMGAGKVMQNHGYYTLAEHKSYIEARWRGYYFGIQRERRIKRYALWLKFIPFIDGVALAGSQALGLEKQGSDIDLFIITKHPYIWLPRTLVTAFFQLFGVRRHSTLIADRFCLNHYVSEPKIMKTGKNWYTALEYTKLRPLVGASAIYAFQQNNLDWLQTFFPNIHFSQPIKVFKSNFQRVLERFIDTTLGAFIESQLKAWQIKRIRLDDPHTLALSNELFFSPHSKEDKILEGFLKLKQ